MDDDKLEIRQQIEKEHTSCQVFLYHGNFIRLIVWQK